MFSLNMVDYPISLLCPPDFHSQVEGSNQKTFLEIFVVGGSLLYLKVIGREFGVEPVCMVWEPVSMVTLRF